jgi:tRNA A37 threonylcarbamoyladenosine biosynthesis protein TsaE
MLDNGALIIEWAEKIMDALPTQYLKISMRWMEDEKRGMTFDPSGERYKKMLAEFRKLIYGGS